MSRKSKGIGAERELIRLFWGTGSWAAVRVAGSGAIRYPVPDIVAANNIRKLAIECKVTADTNQHFSKKEVSDLKTFSAMFGAESWVAIKYNNKGWYFLSLEDLKENQQGLSVNIDLAERRGLSFAQLTKGFG